MRADPADIVTVAVMVAVGARLVGGARASGTAAGRSLVSTIVRGIRWRHVWPVPLVVGAVLAAAGALMLVPGLDWGWWYALGGEGNPVFGSNASTSGSLWEWLIPALFLGLLVPALPLFAHAEERIFRSGAERWSRARRVVKVLQFGAVHALIGIPIAAALALSVGGAYFMHCYLRAWAATGDPAAATMESTRAHTAYNAVVVAGVAVLLALLPAG